tara:strand:- start:1987 stop:2688 length:702 start_codon:yes stop_codon:yes gene_type:complete
MVRSSMRFGNKGGSSSASPREGGRGASGGAVNMQFRLDWDDTEFINAIKNMGEDGGLYMKATLTARVELGIEETQGKLKKMAGALASINVPSWMGSKSSKSIYVTIAESLKQEDIPGSEFIRVHTAENSKSAHIGRMGSRGISIAKILVAGHKPYKYPHYLPKEVRSGVGWFAKSGQAGGLTIGMMKKGTHPGFKRTYDYMLNVENHVAKHFKDDAHTVIKAIALVNGFDYAG